MSSNDVIQRNENGCLTLQFNRPKKKNALTSAMYETLTSALNEAELDESVRLIHFRGDEQCFTAGNDIEDFVNNPPIDNSSPVVHFLHALASSSKVLISSTSGPAIGIGTTLLLHCDLNYCSEHTHFQLPFVNLGLCPEAGSSLLLPKRIGYSKAAELLLLGESFGASDALEFNLVNHVLPSSELLAYSEQKIQALLKKPKQALHITKQLLKQHDRQGLMGAITEECQYFSKCLGSIEAKEAFKQFLS